MSEQDVFQILTPGVSDRDDLDRAFVRCFSTKEGQTVLEHLRKPTNEQPRSYPGADATHGLAREGQTRSVREH